MLACCCHNVLSFMHFFKQASGSPFSSPDLLHHQLVQETIRVNVIGTLTLADLCATHGIHMTNFATGAASCSNRVRVAIHEQHFGHSWKSKIARPCFAFQLG